MRNIIIDIVKKIVIAFLILISFCHKVFATQITYPTVYGPTSQVTNVTLNGNNSAISNVVNGNLDNSNANTVAGYRFYQTVSSLPSAGQTGQVYYLTTDNSLNFDTGSTFIKTIAISGSPVQGNVVIYGASGLVYATTGSAGQVFTSGGAGTNPSFGGITAAGIVNGSSLTSLPSIPSGAGLIPKANIGGVFGSWSTGGSSCGGSGSSGCTINTIYGPATTDGFLTMIGSGGSGEVSCITDSSATPTTARSGGVTSTQGLFAGCSTPVRKGDYFEAFDTGVTGVTVYFLPLGS